MRHILKTTTKKYNTPLHPVPFILALLCLPFLLMRTFLEGDILYTAKDSLILMDNGQEGFSGQSSMTMTNYFWNWPGDRPSRVDYKLLKLFRKLSTRPAINLLTTEYLKVVHVEIETWYSRRYYDKRTVTETGQFPIKGRVVIYGVGTDRTDH